MRKATSIHVSGDSYRALFYIPPGRFSLEETHGERAYAFVIPVGVEYIYRAILAACNPKALLDRASTEPLAHLKIGRIATKQAPFSSREDIVALYDVSNVDSMPDCERPGQKLPVLRLTASQTQIVGISGLKFKGAPVDGSDGPNEKPSVRVHWFGELAGNEGRETVDGHPPDYDCDIHLQVGLASPLQTSDDPKGIHPGSLARPRIARILVVNIGEVSSTHRIRRSLSYEAIAVDLLRYLRGDGGVANPTTETKTLQQLSMQGAGAAPLSVLAVRINNSAVFLYSCSWWESNGNADGDFEEHGSWLLCHKQECAPLSQPELGQMVGHTGFVSAQIAAAMADYLSTDYQLADKMRKRQYPFGAMINAIIAGVQRSIVWQQYCYEQGYFHMLFKWDSKSQKWRLRESGEQTPNSAGYDAMFHKIARALHERQKQSVLGGIPASTKEIGGRVVSPLRLFDSLVKSEVHTIQVQIERAVAHRTQWFMARSVASNPTGLIETVRDCSSVRSDSGVADEFLKTALGWLSKTGNEKIREPRKSLIPIVRIGDAELTDRREVEDYLAIHQALRVYAISSESKPLNIAVFGAPGAGKSFAVKQVVKHIAGTTKRKFQKDELTFNLGQFKSLEDLPAALHLVRNECLSGRIPIVFFDEFDSSFNGQPFGWLRFFLAPMQDGEFYDQGNKYRLGRAVFVFAGGVNRSFEELNGRVRNPSFCEAKGPDFISRLKAHLNVQGINKPEEDSDQYRYILRRGILLRGIVRKKLELRNEQENVELLHPSVAKALLCVERFKHGVRSLEAIIKMCSTRPGHPIGPSDLPSMDQLEMHVDGDKLLRKVDGDFDDR